MLDGVYTYWAASGRLMSAYGAMLANSLPPPPPPDPEEMRLARMAAAQALADAGDREVDRITILSAVAETPIVGLLAVPFLLRRVDRLEHLTDEISFQLSIAGDVV